MSDDEYMLLLVQRERDPKIYNYDAWFRSKVKREPSRWAILKQEDEEYGA